MPLAEGSDCIVCRVYSGLSHLHSMYSATEMKLLLLGRTCHIPNTPRSRALPAKTPGAAAARILLPAAPGAHTVPATVR